MLEKNWRTIDGSCLESLNRQSLFIDDGHWQKPPTMVMHDGYSRRLFPTVTVLGHSLSYIQPPHHRLLSEAISDQIIWWMGPIRIQITLCWGPYGSMIWSMDHHWQPTEWLASNSTRAVWTNSTRGVWSLKGLKRSMLITSGLLDSASACGPLLTALHWVST